MHCSRLVKRTAFSLIELLVVVAMIAILLTILFPSFQFSREGLRSTGCEGGLFALYQGVHMYQTDHDRILPDGFGGWSGGSWRWESHVKRGLIFRYVQDVEAYRCPKFTQMIATLPTHDRYHVTDGKGYGRSYSGNGLMGASNGNRLRWGPYTGFVKFNEPRYLNEIMMFTDDNPWVAHPYSRYAINDGRYVTGRYDTKRPLGGPKHGVVDGSASYHFADNGSGLYATWGISNMVFWDGHVDGLTPDYSKEVFVPREMR